MWRVFAQNSTAGGEGSPEDDDGDVDDFTARRGSDSEPLRATTEDVRNRHGRAAAVDLSEQTFNDRRGAAVRIARDLGIQLLSSETIDQWEHRLASELRIRGAELVASDVNGRPMRLGDDGWELVRSQGPIRDATPGSQRVRPRSRNRARPAAQSAGSQTTAATPGRMVLQQERLGPRTMARQVQAERRRNTPIQLTTTEEAARRARFQQATVNERQRIEAGLAARNLPMLSEDEVQRRLQPIRDLMSAPPILASIQSSIGANETSASQSLRARASELQRLEAEETERLRVENRQRRNAVTVNDMVPSELLNAADSVEQESIDTHAMEIDGEEVDSSESDGVSLPELEEVHGDSSTTLSVPTSAPDRSRRSDSPSPEETRAPLSRGMTAHQQRVCNDGRLHLPSASLCSQHSDTGWELHSARPSHAVPEDDVMKCFVMDMHNESPRTYNKAMETLVPETCEVLVYYDGCKHVEAVFIERLYYPDGSRYTARCGCDAFGDRLLHLRKVLSRQKCIACRTEDARHRHPEQFSWLEKYVRPIETEREYRLWPFGSKCNNGVLDYR